MLRDLAALPKAHLHLHLEGAMRPATLREWSDEDGVEVPPVRPFEGFGAFADLYVSACQRVQDETRMRRLVREVVEDAAADGVTWLEPTFYAPRYAGVLGPTARDAIEVVLDELVGAGSDLGVGTGLIVSSDRTADPAEALELAHLAVTLAAEGHAVIGFGLANDESRFPAGPFAPAFRVAVDGGLLAVPHGGELLGPESVRACVDDCRAHRVMHGIRCVEDPELVKRLADDGVCLDVCPTSNLALSVVATMAEHPLPELIAAGVMCSINADDPLLFGPGVAEEYDLCRAVLGLSDETLAQVAIWSIEASAAPQDFVARQAAAVQAWLSSPGWPIRGGPA
ncbi:MAG TPA: adenosine deaminase [Acidimicrobiales bacterium]|jgi:adenosine deaminase|nr:adenosine deaminase [Acidimicrobiales bacterium]